jgi:hypothetical protein
MACASQVQGVRDFSTRVSSHSLLGLTKSFGDDDLYRVTGSLSPSRISTEALSLLRSGFARDIPWETERWPMGKVVFVIQTLQNFNNITTPAGFDEGMARFFSAG